MIETVQEVHDGFIDNVSSPAQILHVREPIFPVMMTPAMMMVVMVVVMLQVGVTVSCTGQRDKYMTITRVHCILILLK